MPRSHRKTQKNMKVWVGLGVEIQAQRSYLQKLIAGR